MNPQLDCDLIAIDRRKELDTARASEARLREALAGVRVCASDIQCALGTGKCEINTCDGCKAESRIASALAVEICAQADTALSGSSGEWMERHDAEKDAEIERLTRSNQNWQNRADYAPCPNCLRTEGMALSSRKESRQECVYCVTCGYEGPGVEGSPSRETDREAIAAWCAEYAAARQRFLTAASRAEKAEAERDGLSRRHAKSGHDMDTSGVCDADCPTCARLTAEARRKVLMEVYERVKNLRGCNAYDVIDSIEEMAKETTNG